MKSPFLSFVLKEFKHIFRDRRTMLILLGMPIAQILLFGFAISTEVKNSQVAVLDPMPDATTRRIIARVDASEYFNVTHRIHDIAEADELFRKGDISLALVFSENFTSNLRHTGEARVQLVADGCEPNQAQMVTGYMQQVLSQAISAEQFKVQSSKFNAAPFSVSTRMLYNPQSKSAYNFVPGVMGMILLLICAMMTSVSIVREKETGTMEILLASPMPPLGIIIAKAVPYFVLSCVNLTTILLLSKFVLQVPVQGNLVLLLGISMIYILLSLALGLFVSNIVRTQMAAVLISGMGFIMPTIILSGLMFPIESMPNILQWISCIIPARWFISAIRKVMIEGVGLVYVWKEVLILSATALVLLAASIKQFKVRLS